MRVVESTLTFDGLAYDARGGDLVQALATEPEELSEVLAVVGVGEIVARSDGKFAWEEAWAGLARTLPCLVGTKDTRAKWPKLAAT
jgi:hypothetical protein